MDQYLFEHEPDIFSWRSVMTPHDMDEPMTVNWRLELMSNGKGDYDCESDDGLNSVVANYEIKDTN